MGVYFTYGQTATQAQAEAEMQHRARQQYANQQRRFLTQPAFPTHREACALLEVEEGATHDEIRAAFTKRVKAMHPDAGGTGGDIAALKKARDYLLTTEFVKSTEYRKEGLTCPLCGGTGMVPSGFGVTVCSSCKGSGHVI